MDHENSNICITDNIINSSQQSEQKIKRKRRSKKDPNGRMFICQCGKGYLSKLALNNHTKSKHEHIQKNKIFINHDNHDQISTYKKKRGRPKKSFDILTNNELFYSTFFDNLKRKKNQNLINENKNGFIPQYVFSIFNDVYINNEKYCSLRIKNAYEHPLIKKYFCFNIESPEKAISCDEIFIQYLNYLKNNTNQEYFEFAFKFILLLRECINKYKNIELENMKEILEEGETPEEEFTQIYDGEQIPEICNEFLTEFLTSANFFGEKNENKIEFQKLIQHFCYWLYQNNYTSAKLTLNSKINE